MDVLDIINEVFNGILGEVPYYNTIDNWVKKCGLDVYNNAGTTISNKPYAEIVDESMMVGSNKLLLTLGVPADHMGRPLKHEDVSVLDMCVDKSFNGERVRERLDASAQTVGHDPRILPNKCLMSNWVSRADRMLEVYHSLSQEEKEVFVFAPSNTSLIKELAKVMSCINFIETECYPEK